MIKIHNGLKHINAFDLQKLMMEKDLIIIDIREQFEIDITSVPKSINIPIRVMINNSHEFLKKDQEYFLLCHTGQRSYYLTELLSSKGYNVVNVMGGIAQMKDFYIHY